MKFIVNRHRGRNLQHEFNADNLARILTIFWQQGLDVEQAEEMNPEKMQTLLDNVFEAHKGSESFTYMKYIEGIPMGLSFNGAWDNDQFQVHEVKLSAATYTRKEKSTRDIKLAFQAAKRLENPVHETDADQAERPGFLKSAYSVLAKTASVLVKFVPVVSLVAGVNYFARNTLIEGVKNLAARAGVVVPARLMVRVPLIFGIAALVLSQAIDVARRLFKSSKEASYVAKTEEELDALTPAHVNAFLDGVAAQQSYVAQAKTCFRFNDYRHGNAFYAGMGAQAKQNNELIEKVEARKLSA